MRIPVRLDARLVGRSDGAAVRADGRTRLLMGLDRHRRARRGDGGRPGDDVDPQLVATDSERPRSEHATLVELVRLFVLGPADVPVDEEVHVVDDDAGGRLNGRVPADRGVEDGAVVQ